MKRNRIEINEVEAQLLCNLSDRQIPTTTYPRTLSNTLYGQEDWSAHFGVLTFDNQVPKLKYSLPLKMYTNRHDDSEKSFWGAKLEAVTDDNERFQARHAYLRGSVTNYGGLNSGYHIRINPDDWFLYKEEAFIWAGYLSEVTTMYLGNLMIQIKDRFISHGHFSLRGESGQYYLLNQKEKSLLAIRPNEALPNLSSMKRDLVVLSFCFGFPLSCQFLTGLDRDGKIVGHAGGELGFCKIKKNNSWPIIPYNDYGCVELFEKIVKKIVEINAKDKKLNFLYEAVWLYVEASAETWVNSSEVKLFLACLNAAHCIIIDDSMGDFLEWDKGNITLSYDDLSDGYNPDVSPIEKISSALDLLNLSNKSELLQIAKESFNSVFGFTKEDVPTSRKRQQKLITLCATLISHFVNYSGPIYDWQLEEETEIHLRARVNPDENFYKASIDAVSIKKDVADLWPIFHEPTIPSGSLVSLVDNFAKSLAPRTENRVRARVAPVPSVSEDESQLFDFVVESTKYPLANYTLFTIYQENPNSSLEIKNWDDLNHELNNEQDIIQFLTHVANSDKTKETVERILLVIPNE